MKRRKTTAGGVQTAIDVQRVSRALSGPGADTRSWIVSATVGKTIDGEFNTDDPTAIYKDASGVLVDVQVQPEGFPLTARYHGLYSSAVGTLILPIRPGQEVLVLVPGGNFRHPGIAILPFGANSLHSLPDDWNNDRVLFIADVVIEMRAPGIAIDSPNLTLNGRAVAPSRTPI